MPVTMPPTMISQNARDCIDFFCICLASDSL
jgi:hypothetical protein